MMIKSLDLWLSTIYNKRVVLRDSLSPHHLSNLFATIPTRDGSSSPSHPFISPIPHHPLPYGHHLAFFHHHNPEHLLRHDAADPVFCPPDPFTTRMWASGSMTWNNHSPLRVGINAQALSSVSQIVKKNFDRPSPLLFVKQSIDYSSEHTSHFAIREERSHVYLTHSPSTRTRRVVKEGILLPFVLSIIFPSTHQSFSS
jgi:hydroxyacyl-ACP dehydratase HTD2-like protein with hotdog domain